MIHKPTHYFRCAAFAPSRSPQNIPVADPVPVQLRVKHSDKFSRFPAIKHDQREAVSRLPFRGHDLQEFVRVGDAEVGHPAEKPSNLRIGRIGVEDSLCVLDPRAAKTVVIGLKTFGQAIHLGHPARIKIQRAAASLSGRLAPHQRHSSPDFSVPSYERPLRGCCVAAMTHARTAAQGRVCRFGPFRGTYEECVPRPSLAVTKKPAERSLPASGLSWTQVSKLNGQPAVINGRSVWHLPEEIWWSRGESNP